MPVKHVYTAGSGDLISSTIWNQDHTITNGVTMLTVPFVLDTTGATVGPSNPNWMDIPKAEFYIPNAHTLTFTRGHLSVHVASSVNSTIEFQIIDSGDDGSKVLGTVAQACPSPGAYYTGIGADLIIGNYPSSNTIYKAQVRSSAGTGTVTTCSLILYLEAS